jgi:hypothetical protein
MAADGKLLRGQISERPGKVADPSAVESLLKGFLRALSAERAESPQSPSVLEADAGDSARPAAPPRLRELVASRTPRGSAGGSRP